VMDGRSDDDSADATDSPQADSSGDRAGRSADGTAEPAETGWPYEPDVDVGDGTAPDAGPESSLEDASTSEVASVFWRVLLLVDVALLCLTIGALLIVVRGSPGRGVGVFALGIASMAYAYHRYREYRRNDDAGATGDGAGTGDDLEDPVDAERNG